MNSKTVARLMLSLPFLTLIESIGYFKFYDWDPNKKDLLMNINVFWNFIAIFWFIPYTILAIYLLIWSRKKTFEQIKNTYIIAPFMMMYLSSGLYFLISIVELLLNKNASYSGSPILLLATTVSIPASLLFGYAFVGVSLVFYKVLQKLKILQD